MHIEQALMSLQGDRPDNQDSARFFTNGHDYFAVLCDGLGGYPDGGEAARLFCESFEQAVRQPSQDPGADAHQTLSFWIDYAQQNLLRQSQLGGLSAEARTTFVCVWINDNGTVVAHGGDSRAYALNHAQILWRTRDHSLFELSVMAGELEDDPDARPRGQQKLLYRCVQTQKPVKPTITTYAPLAPGQSLLLLSDGAWYPWEDNALTKLYRFPDLQQGLAHLLQGSVQRAAPRADNATAVAIRCF